MKTGIFGGSFNPVHNGHLKIALDFKDKFELDRVLFIPNNISPFKIVLDDLAPAKHRLKMLEIVLKDYPSFEIEDFEIKRTGISYTSDTIRYLKQKYPQDKFMLLIGTDQASSFHKWKDFDYILRELVVVIANRNSNVPPAELPPALNNAPKLNNELINISSSEIRDRIRKGQSIIELLPFEVAEYIVNNMLYL